MIDFSDVIEKTENDNLNAEANARLYSDGATKPLDFSGASATAQAVIESEHPAQSGIKWEELSRVEQVANSLEGGYHGLVKGGVADDALRYQAWSSLGFSGLTGDIDEDIDDESRAAIEKLLNKDTLANREFKQKAFVKAMDSVKEYRELERKDSLYATPIGMKKAVDAAEGKGFVDGTAAALGEVFSGDVLGNMIYLAGSSFGAMAPYVVQTAALGGVSSLNAVRAMGATNRVRSALAGASMGMGEHSMESGAYLLEEMNKRGLDPKDIESYRKLFESDYDEFQRNRSARSTVVSAFGALSGVSLVTKFNPRESYRKMMTALRDAQSSRDLMVKKGFAKPTVTTTPATRASVFGDEMLNISTQSLIQGTLGGAGEYLGTKATGEDPNMAEVLFEFLGEFTSAPVEVASLSATTINGYRNDAVMANTAKVGQNALTKMTQATEAVANQIKDNESLQQWAERVGEDRSLLAFGQDLVDNGQVEEIRKVDPELAEKIDKAAEEKQTVEVPVSKVVGIAAQNRKLADDIIYDSRVSIDGMTPRQADDFEKNGRVEAEKKLDDILAKTRISKEHAKEAREVSKEITDALVQDGMSQQYASMAGKVWESYLVQRSRLLGVSPREIANAMNWRVVKENGLRAQHAEARGSLVDQPEGVDADIDLPQTVQIDGQEVSAVDSEGNYVGRNAEEVTSFYRWFNGKGDDERGMGQTLANRDVSGETSSSEFSFAREWTDDERKKGYRDGDKRIGIDSKGRPRVFYHGTTALFDTVQLGHKGQLDSGYMGRGFYLTSNPKQAETYIYRKKLSGVEDSVGEFNMAMYAKALNPVEISRELYGEMHAANSEMMPIASDHLRKKFIEAGYDSAYIVQYDGGKPFIELVVFEPSQVKAARSMQDERGRPNTSYDPNDDNMFHQPLSSRYPTAVRKVEDGDAQMLFADYETAKKDAAFMEKNAPLLKTIPGMATKKRKPEAIAEECIERAKDNLTFLFDLVPKTTRERAKLWYDGGRRMSEEWAQRYGIAPQTSAAVIAVLSPQKGWFENVSMGERILDAVFTKRDFVWDEAMTKKADAIANKPELKEDRARAEGKSLGELLANNDYIAAAVWIRCHDQAHNDSAYKILSPEGGAQDYARTDSGKKSNLRWQNYGAIAKAISCIEDPRLANISLQLGSKHKVRNFYNNLAHPESENFATIDTHAVAAATLIPLAASDVIVDQNFGGKGTKKSAASGLSGTYPYFFEAYKRAAAERGVLPREMQSITWEAIRAIYTDRFKTEDNKKAVIEVWKSVDAGTITIEEAREKVVALAGGLKKFAWEDKPYDEAVGDTYDRASVDAQIDVGTGAVNFEVAPDPNDAELTARWNALSKEEKIRISATVAREIVPKVLDEFEAEGTLSEQVGGYLGETNPSFVLDVVKGPQAMPIAKMLGYVLNQDSMMVTTSNPEVGTGETGSVYITLPEGYSYSQIEALYSKLWELKSAKGDPLCGGFSARGNTMTILNFTGYEDAWLADKIRTVVADLDVATEKLNVGFPDRKEGDYNYEGDSRANILRDQATQSLHRELDIAEKQGVSAPDSELAGTDDARNISEQQSGSGGIGGTYSQSGSTLARSGSGTQDGRGTRSEGRVQGTSETGGNALNQETEFKPDEELIDRAVEIFGTTKDTKEAFYILPDGRMLDGSGRHWGGDERDVAGQRQVDHQDINEALDSDASGSEALYEWMGKTGAMRFDQIVGIASIARDPTPEQLKVLKRAAKGNYLALSFNTPEGRIVDDTEFDYTTDSDIDEFFDRAIALRNEGVQGAWAQKTGQVRGTYSPRSAAGISSKTAGLITLMEAADKSTFMHESAHAWLDADTYLAQALVKKYRSGKPLTAGEEAFLKNFGAFLRWGQDEKVLSLGVGEDLDSICNGLEAWANMTVNEQRGMHELFAVGFESYLMGGEAPNTQLIEMFKQFAQWLKEVYAKMTSRPRPLSPEIRKLYDQLFVSEQEAADAEARAGLTKMFSDLDTDLMSDAERAEYDRLCYEANQETQSVIARSLSSAMRLYANVREGTRALLMRLHKDRVAMVQDRLNKEPRYIAYMMLTTGYKQKGSDNAISTKLSRQGMKDAGFDKKTIALLKRRQLVDEVGVTPEVLASMCGHSNPLALIGELLEIRGLDNEACNIVAAQVKEETGLGVEAYSELRADLAAHNATRSRVLTAEHNIIARKLGKRQLLIGAAREYAIEKIGAMKMADIRPYVYHRDEKRCAREAEVAFRKGDFERCLEMKRAQILNHELARAAMEVQDKFEKGQRRVKRAMKSKTIYPAYQQLLSYIAKQHGMDYRSNVKDIDALTALKIAASLEADGTPVDGVTPSADSLPVALIEKDLDAMTADEVNVLFDALRQLETLGRARLTIVKDGIKAKVSELIEEGVGTLEANAQEQGRISKVERIPLTRKEKAFDTLQRFFYAHIKIATWCRIFDGNKSGFFTRTFIQTANERAGWEEDQRVKVAERVRDIMRPVFKNNRMFEDDKVRIGIRMMSKGERIAAALNMGNESNFQRLVDGDRAQWTAEAVQDLQESLTADDWRAVQMIWDLFESYRPLIAEKEQRVYGVEPEWIDIKEIEVLSKGGQKIKLKGGYYPVVYDPRASNIADVHQDATAIEQSMKGAWQSATTRRSFTKSRVAEVHDRPLRLDLSALYSGLDDVIHDLAWHEWLIDTHRLLQGVSSDGGLRESIKEYYGYHVAKAFEEWRQAIALGDRAEMDGTTRKIFHWAGGNVGLTAMGYSFTSALAQLTGIGYIVPRCGTVHTIAALKDYLKNPKNIRKAINAKSTLMRNRHISATKQVSDIRNVLERGKENLLTKYAYSMLLAVQSMVDAIAWQAGYRKALSEGKTEEAAMQEADQIVIDTQSSGRVNDLSAIERNEYLAPFTVFYSWANAALNQSFAVAQSETSKPKKLAQLFYMGVIMPVIDGLFRECMKIDGDDDDDDDEKDWFDYMLLMPAAKSIEYHCGLLVGVREVANAAGSVVSGDVVWKYGGPAGVRGISTVVDLGNAIQDPVSWSSFNTFVDLTGLAGLPSTQIKKTVKGFRAIESGQAEGFDAMLAPFFGFSGKIEE